MVQVFKMKADRVIGDLKAKAGDTVYRCIQPDYGCAADDAEAFGVPHTSVTRDPGGAYPFFTVPDSDLEPI